MDARPRSHASSQATAPPGPLGLLRVPAFGSLGLVRVPAFSFPSATAFVITVTTRMPWLVLLAPADPQGDQWPFQRQMSQGLPRRSPRTSPTFTPDLAVTEAPASISARAWRTQGPPRPGPPTTRIRAPRRPPSQSWGPRASGPERPPPCSGGRFRRAEGGAGPGPERHTEEVCARRAPWGPGAQVTQRCRRGRGAGPGRGRSGRRPGRAKEAEPGCGSRRGPGRGRRAGASRAGRRRGRGRSGAGAALTFFTAAWKRKSPASFRSSQIMGMRGTASMADKPAGPGPLPSAAPAAGSAARTAPPLRAGRRSSRGDEESPHSLLGDVVPAMSAQPCAHAQFSLLREEGREGWEPPARGERSSGSSSLPP